MNEYRIQCNLRHNRLQLHVEVVAVKDTLRRSHRDCPLNAARLPSTTLSTTQPQPTAIAITPHIALGPPPSVDTTILPAAISQGDVVVNEDEDTRIAFHSREQTPDRHDVGHMDS